MPAAKTKRPAVGALLVAYREAVVELAISLREHKLTASHFARTDGAVADAQLDALHAVNRELTKRLARFEQIEPARWKRHQRELDAAYAARDAENRVAEAQVARGALP